MSEQYMRPVGSRRNRGVSGYATRTDCRMPVQGRADFARFDAIPADLDLVIHPSHKCDLTVRKFASEIA